MGNQKNIQEAGKRGGLLCIMIPKSGYSYRVSDDTLIPSMIPSSIIKKSLLAIFYSGIMVSVSSSIYMGVDTNSILEVKT